MDKDTFWSEILQRIEMQIPKAAFNNWLRNSRAVSLNDKTIVISAESAYAKDWIENRLIHTISRIANDISQSELQIEVTINSTDQQPTAVYDTPMFGTSEPASRAYTHKLSNFSLPLNPKYSFDQFIVGASNRLAHAASWAVAKHPGDSQQAHNPLFLYGGVGLGKTHLLQAIAHVAHDRGDRVIYITSETFTNDLVDAIRSRSTDAFREKYRSTEFLLIDDIQFIAGKESTQEELFHTFNTLHSAGGQIVLSSDRPPKAIQTLEERLLSRFEWGLLADVQPPDLETRMAILRFKSEDQAVDLPNDVVEFIARRAKNNIRELEGAFNKVMAHARMAGQMVNMSLAEMALKDLAARRSELTVAQVIEAVAKSYRFDEKALLGRKRTKDIAAARQMAMYLAREETDASLPQIGEALGGRDHTTIKHGIEKIANLIEIDDKLRREMLAIREMIYNENNVNFY